MTDSPDSTREGDTPREELEELIDEWGLGSFPASDPPGYLPPSLKSADEDDE